MMLKKKKILVAAFALIFTRALSAQQVTIDTALANAVGTIGRTVPEGTKIAVLNMASDYQKLSDYIVDELIVGLVNTGRFQVLPRGAVEMELAKNEMEFQYSGNVSDESQKSLGKFLGAGTIISGSVTRDSASSYRMIINAIDVESFTYQASSRIAVTDDSQMKQLVVVSGGEAYYDDYTTGQRLGIGATNIAFGLGSIVRGQKSGWFVTTLEILGGILIVGTQAARMNIENPVRADYPADNYGEQDYKNDLDAYEYSRSMGRVFIITGTALAGTGVALGFILPFFLHKPAPASVAAAPEFPLDLRLVSAQNGNLALNLTYTVSF